MTKEEALRYVASVMAVRAEEHIRAAREIPYLAQNTREALEKLESAAAALGIEKEYKAALENLRY